MALMLTVLGCGDLFGSGGRRQAAFLLQANGTGLLLDCGASVMSGLGAARLDALAIDVALISHLHGDHVGGLPFLYMANQFAARRSSPLIVAGPPGIEEKAEGLFRLMFTPIRKNVGGQIDNNGRGSWAVCDISDRGSPRPSS